MAELRDKITKLCNKYRELIVYVIVGGCTTVIGTGGYWFFVWLGFEPEVANVLSWIFAVAFAYCANKIFVFRDKVHGFSAVFKQICTFVTSRLFSLAVETLLIWLGTDIFSVDKYLIKIPVAVVVVALNYITGKFVVFLKNK